MPTLHVPKFGLPWPPLWVLNESYEYINMICDRNKSKITHQDFVWKFPLKSHLSIDVKGNVLFGYGRFDFLG